MYSGVPISAPCCVGAPLHAGASPSGGAGGVSFGSQVIGTLACVLVALAGGFVVYGILHRTAGIRLQPKEEMLGSDLVVHSSKAYPEELF